MQILRQVSREPEFLFFRPIGNQEVRAALPRERRRLHPFPEAERLPEIDDGGEHRLADMEAGKTIGLERQRIAARAGEDGGRGGPRGATANDDAIPQSVGPKRSQDQAASRGQEFDEDRGAVDGEPGQVGESVCGFGHKGGNAMRSRPARP